MDKEIKFSDNEFSIIKNLYENNLKRLIIFFVGLIIVGGILIKMFDSVPMKFLFKRNRNNDYTVFENLGYISPIIVLLLSFLFVTIVVINELKIFKLKKDIKERAKIVTNLKVKRIFNLSDSKIKEMREIGKMETSDLIFEENTFNIKLYSFDKFKEPELLQAKEMYLEIAKYSKIEFVRKINIG
jgi:hypothetical protein